MAITKDALFPELRQWLKDTGQRQYDLARVLGVSTGAVSRWLSGKNDISADRAIRLSLLTKIAPELLVNDPETARNLKFLGKQSKLIGRESNESAGIV
jgi:transcriptional regulator with XRE-family HTH domain